ncbi:GGDEF domain-containing protein [Anaerocolumna sp. MB42-C2]|uniref:GGDEF domain-containing protein n=1 Tax=Anaerocolumna sp. MB42-C2 TaxID=3070997 RepID=UPI0027DEFCF3|nr:GGDEF domain-containing protein [Anaerocolumna sp. MB42-C2]WMJ90761.1 GGDEF domain-containing protein [Anaerocolumna sp. MB42-C2]
MINNLDEIHINEIRKEYKRIDNDWLLFQYKISIGLFLFAFLVECFMAVILINSVMLTTTVNRFILKFIIAPSAVNFICIICDTLAMRAKKLTQDQKIYVVSINLVIISFILFTAHSAFTSTHFLFILAIILTTIYASYRVTGITALLSITALIGSELFIKWDSDKPSVYASTLRFSEFLISLSIIISTSIVCMIKIAYMRKKNEASIQKELERELLEQKLKLDELTGVFNRKALHDAMRDLEMNRAPSFVFVITDIDNFKSVNDQFGHHVGDNCLIDFATVLKKYSAGPSVFRYGGDEFCLIYENFGIDEVVSTCERLQTILKDLFKINYPTLNLTASFGIAPYTDDCNAARLFIHADQALYEAKEIKNAIRVYH